MEFGSGVLDAKAPVDPGLCFVPLLFQGLDLPTERFLVGETLTQENGTWQERSNREGVPVDWRFTTEDARIKLKPLYPST